METLVNEPVFP